MSWEIHTLKPKPLTNNTASTGASTTVIMRNVFNSSLALIGVFIKLLAVNKSMLFC